jgi:hypothetical protein
MTFEEQADNHKFELYDAELDLNMPEKGWVRIVMDYCKTDNPILDWEINSGALILDSEGYALRGKFVRTIMHTEDRDV